MELRAAVRVAIASTLVALAVSTAVVVGDGHGEVPRRRLLILYVEASSSSAVAVEEALQSYAGKLRRDPATPDIEVLREIGRSNRMALVERWADLDQSSVDRMVEALRDRIGSKLQAPIDDRFGSDLTTAGASLGKAGNFHVLIHIDVAPPGADSAAEDLRRQSMAVVAAPDAVLFEAATQSEHPNHFGLHEVWRRRSAYEAFAASQAAKAFRDRLGTIKGALFDDRYYVELGDAGAGPKGGIP